MSDLLDIPWEFKTNSRFRALLEYHAAEISKLEGVAAKGRNTAPEVGKHLLQILRLCNFNPGLLVPYYFPAYPEKEPLSLFARPFSFAMFNLQIGGFTVIRASRQIGKSTALVARQKLLADRIPNYRALYIVPHQENLDTYANRFREMERVFRFPTNHPQFRQNLTYKEYLNGAIVEMARVLSNANDGNPAANSSSGRSSRRRRRRISPRHCLPELL